MKKYFSFCILFILLSTTLSAIEMDLVLEKVQNNMQVKNVIYSAVMTVEEVGSKREMEMSIYIKNENNVYIEVLESSVGHTSRVLRKDGQFWLYIPSAGRSVKIKGHMLKDGFMGSNFTYEDMSEYRKLEDLYNISMQDEDSFYVLTMKAKVDDAPYKMKKSYIRKDIFLPAREEIYSSSERLLKEFIIQEYVVRASKNIPSKMIMHDMLRQGEYTEIVYKQIVLVNSLDSKYFQKTYLER